MQLLKSVILYSACSFLILNVNMLQVHSFNSSNKATFISSHMQSQDKNDLNTDADLEMKNLHHTSTVRNRAEDVPISDKTHDGGTDYKKIIEDLLHRKQKSLNSTVISEGAQRTAVLYSMNYLKRLKRRTNPRRNDIICSHGKGSHGLVKCIRKNKRSQEQSGLASNVEPFESDLSAVINSNKFNPRNPRLNKQKYKSQSYKKKLKQGNKFDKANLKKIPAGKYSNKITKQHYSSGKNRYGFKKGGSVSQNKKQNKKYPKKFKNQHLKDGKNRIYSYSKIGKNGGKFGKQKSMKNYKKAPKVYRKISNPEEGKVIATGKLKKYNKTKKPSMVESRKNKPTPASKVKNQNRKKNFTETARKPASKVNNKNVKKIFTKIPSKPTPKVNNKNIKKIFTAVPSKPTSKVSNKNIKKISTETPNKSASKVKNKNTKKNSTDIFPNPDVKISIKLSRSESEMMQTIKDKNEKNPTKSKVVREIQQKKTSYEINDNNKFIQTSGKNNRDIKKKVRNQHNPDVKISIMSPVSKSKAYITVKDKQHNFTRSKRMKEIDRRLYSNEFQKLKVKRKVGLHRSFPLRNHLGNKRSVNIRKQNVRKSLDRNARDDKANILYEIKDFIVKNFRNREQRHTLETLHGHQKRNGEKENSYNRITENTNANSSQLSGISGNENGNFGLLEEIKDFVVEHFHPEKSKRNASDHETRDDMSKMVKRETNKPPSFMSENITLSEYDTILENNPKREAVSPTTIHMSNREENTSVKHYVPIKSSSTNEPYPITLNVYDVDHEYNDMTDGSVDTQTNDKEGDTIYGPISSKMRRETDPSESSEIYPNDIINKLKNTDENVDNEAGSEREDISTTDNIETLMTENYSKNILTSSSSQLFAHPTPTENFESEDQNTEEAFLNSKWSLSSSTSADVESLPSPLPSLIHNNSLDGEYLVTSESLSYLTTEDPSVSSSEFISDIISSTQSVLSDDDYLNYHESSSMYPEQLSTSLVQQKMTASSDGQNVLNGEEYDYEQLPETTRFSESFRGAQKRKLHTLQKVAEETPGIKKSRLSSKLLGGKRNKFNKKKADYGEDSQSDESSVENMNHFRDATRHSIETYSRNGKKHQQNADNYYFEDTSDDYSSEDTSTTQATRRMKHVDLKSSGRDKNMNKLKNSQFINENNDDQLSNPTTHSPGKSLIEQQHDKETDYDYEVSTIPYETESITYINRRDYSSSATLITDYELPYSTNTKANNNQNTKTPGYYEEDSSTSSNPSLGKRQGDTQMQRQATEYDYEDITDPNDSESITSKEALSRIMSAATQFHRKGLLQSPENNLERPVTENENEQNPDLGKYHLKNIDENAASSFYDYDSNTDSSEVKTLISSINTATQTSENELFGEWTVSPKDFYSESVDQNEKNDGLMRNHQNLKHQDVGYDYENTVGPTQAENINGEEAGNSELHAAKEVSDKDNKKTIFESAFIANDRNYDKSQQAKYFTVKRNNKTSEKEGEEKAEYENENTSEAKNLESSEREMRSSTVNIADEIFHKDLFGGDETDVLQTFQDEDEDETKILSHSSTHPATTHRNRNEKETKEQNQGTEIEYEYVNTPDSDDSEGIMTEISNSIKNNKWVASKKDLPQKGKEENPEFSQNDNEDLTNFASFQDASVNSKQYAEPKYRTRNNQLKSSKKSKKEKGFDQEIEETMTYPPDLHGFYPSKEAQRTTEITESTTELVADDSEIFEQNDATQDVLENSKTEYDDYENSPDSTIDATSSMKSGRESRNLKEDSSTSTEKDETQTTSHATSFSHSSTNDMTSVTEINSLDMEMTTEIYNINSIESVGIRDVSNNASNLNESFTTTLNTTEMSEKYGNTGNRESENNSKLATHAATLQNVQIMPEITTVNREARDFNTRYEDEESTTWLEEDYQNLNGTNEEYYDEIAKSNSGKHSEYSSANATSVSHKNKRIANEKQVVEHKDDSGYTFAEEGDYEETTTDSMYDDDANTSPNVVENNDFDEESTVAANSARSTWHKAKTRKGDEELKEYLNRVVRSKHRNLRHSYESMTRTKTRKTRDIQSVGPTSLLQIDHRQTSRWLIGAVGLLTISSIILGVYHIIPKRSKVKDTSSDHNFKEVFADGSRKAECCASDTDVSDRWLEDVNHINSFISEVLQKCENSGDGGMREKCSTAAHLLKIHDAMRGTIN